ncbi:MAG: serine/threonine-protein kinase, partial [Myxococcota bacterium]|nr:serine/threonine-protein kinase [Myxococcota bacterium]
MMSRCPHCGQTHGADSHFCTVTGQALDLGPRLIGQVLLDRYEVKTLVGEGPFGAVLRGVDRTSGSDVAIKMLHPRFARDQAAVDRFLDDSRKAGGLGHPNIVVVLDVGRDSAGAPIVVREYFDGVSLAKLLRRKGPLEEPVACWIAGRILAGLAAAHEAGFVNGDVTPDDVFLATSPSGEPTVKVLDFGEAHLKQASGEGVPDKGKAYKAPEQVRSGIVSELSDIYAVGAILYEMVAGRAAYPDGVPPAPQVIPVPPSPSSIRPGLNRKLDILVRRAMSLLPTDRYRTAASFAEALAPFVPARPPAIDLSEPPRGT